MSRRIDVSLSVKSVLQAQRQLKAYIDDFQRKCELFVSKLAEVGIFTGQSTVGNFGKYITFYYQTSIEQYGAKAILYAENTELIVSEWRQADGSVSSAEVSPVLMAEFGAGQKADNAHASPFGMGTGTFPGQTHANDPSGWWYMDLDGQWHHSYGVTPTEPMAQAAEQMRAMINTIAKGVFS